MHTYLVGPGAVWLHLNTVEAAGVALGGEDRSLREETNVDAATHVNQLQQVDGVLGAGYVTTGVAVQGLQHKNCVDLSTEIKDPHKSTSL